MHPLISRHYVFWRIKRWLVEHNDERQLIADDDGRTWQLPDLLHYGEGQTVEVLVSKLWERNQQVKPWGSHHPPLCQMQRDVTEANYLRHSIGSLMCRADLSGSREDHLCRIALFVFAIRNRITPPPLVIDSEGVILDGYHRLVAYHLLDFPAIQAWCLQIIPPPQLVDTKWKS